MKIRDCDEIATWLAEAGLLGIRSEGSLVQAFCERCVEAGLPLGKSFVMIDTLHPMHEARAFFWDEDKSIGFQEENTRRAVTATERSCGSAARFCRCCGGVN